MHFSASLPAAVLLVALASAQPATTPGSTDDGFTYTARIIIGTGDRIFKAENVLLKETTGALNMHARDVVAGSTESSVAERGILDGLMSGIGGAGSSLVGTAWEEAGVLQLVINVTHV
ncbi:hypothetical protein LTR10_000480 [Elasticomyces elasticus]|nr:hypothetical protein LTR10_000480 [Elasticomyces elasticus]KAK4980271.1 hypothetical protein LTR42_000578 [Elasticomyces elasticus]